MGQISTLEEWIYRIASDIGATEAVAFSSRRDFLGDELLLLAHNRPDKSNAQQRAAAVVAFKEIILPCVGQAKDGAIEISGEKTVKGTQFCLVVLARQENGIAGAVAFIVRSADQQTAEYLLRKVQLVSRGSLFYPRGPRI